jgi:hypothetical protein
VAAVDEPPHAVVVVPTEVAHRGGDAEIGRAQGGNEAGGVLGVVEEPEHGRRSMEFPKAADEARVADEVAPALADEGGAGEGGRERREAEEDQGEEVLVVQRRRQGRRGGHCVAVLPSRTDLSSLWLLL